MRLCDALRRALGGLEPEVESIADVLDQFGTIGDVARAFSGQSRGKAYLAARRRFERYRAGLTGSAEQRRRPSEETLDFIKGWLAQRRREVTYGPAHVDVRAEVRVSTDTRRRRVRGELPGGCIQSILELLADDLCDEAEEAFAECFGEENLGGQVPEFLDVDGLEVQPA